MTDAKKLLSRAKETLRQAKRRAKKVLRRSRRTLRQICWRKVRHELYCLIGIVLGIVILYCNENKIIPADYQSNPVSAVIAMIVAYGFGFALGLIVVCSFLAVKVFFDMSYLKIRPKKRHICWKKARHELYCLCGAIIGLVIVYCGVKRLLPPECYVTIKNQFNAVLAAKISFAGLLITLFSAMKFWDVRNDMSYFKRR